MLLKQAPTYNRGFFFMTKRIYFVICLVAITINISLFAYAKWHHNFDLEVLAILNLLLLSFVFLRK